MRIAASAIYPKKDFCLGYRFYGCEEMFRKIKRR